MTAWIWGGVALCLALAFGVLAQRRRSPSTLPVGGAAAVGGAVPRSRLTWLVLASALGVVLLVLGMRVRTPPPGAKLLPPGADAIVILDVSSSLRSSSEQVARALGELTRDGKRKLGLVVFSDSAYEALPPSTGVEGLRGWLRLFLEETPKRYPWTPSFSNGTWISSGLRVALRAIHREHVHDPHVILVSDLVDASPDQAPLENIAARYQREGVDLRVLAVPTEASARGQTPNAFTAPNVTFIERGASHTFVPAAVQPPTRHTGLLVALVALVGLLLAVYELALHPLSWSVRA
jgi:hypothetical protein